ncbi:PREDICTED: uncharacterized protein LOC106746536 [Dinoponera quadriceps]|uniref:Uncharacterized protein LOC106746536 n=1 Tax=Dinoponera quadriceps TaxID=609295 RepID=A0A6P3XKC5_DINQU|nr:PREDICTED: uncharacterized protein LOC106746536 [Dinoponera quadriceps]XP_014478698.1 PREDICTED: uncharacterized protein LOC106746536 [Dinoponera quadriceps]
MTRAQPSRSRRVMNDSEGFTIALVFRRSRISVLKLRNSKDIMPRSQFRLKVNLSKFFNDARRICWIFIDLTKMQHIIHIKQHISKIFGIREPFHLMLHDSEYLPPVEDIRILLENETIKVIPGSGIHNEVIPTKSDITSNIGNFINSFKAETNKNAVHNNFSQATDAKVDESGKINMNINTESDISNDIANDIDPVLTCNNTADVMFATAVDDMEAHSHSKITDCSNLTGNGDTTNSIKRKRIRRRKSKSSCHQNSQVSSELDSQVDTSSIDAKREKKSKKPKIVDDFIISTGKHIRFNDSEDEENNDVKEADCEVSNNNNVKSYTSKGTSRNLSSLLALGKSSTPVTFSKKIKDISKTENLTPIISTLKEMESMESSLEEKAICTKNSSKAKNGNSVSEQNVYIKEVNKKTKSKEPNLHKNCLDLEIKNLPVMTRKPHVGDIIGFKTLKLGEDYTPQISNFIVGEVLTSCADTATYSVKIIKGVEEIEQPSGKFSLSEDNDSWYDEKVSFTFSQFIEPRLITDNLSS